MTSYRKKTQKTLENMTGEEAAFTPSPALIVGKRRLRNQI
jgi:hypothetical protein